MNGASSQERPDVAPDEGARRDDLFAEFIDTRDDPRCPRCGYSLRGLTTGACPECGDALRLEIALVEPRMGALITTLVALSLGFGGSMLFVSVALKAAPGSWWFGVAGITLIIQLVTTALTLPAAIVGRRRLRRLAPARQWILAVAACVAVAVLSLTIVFWFDD